MQFLTTYAIVMRIEMTRKTVRNPKPIASGLFLMTFNAPVSASATHFTPAAPILG